MTTRANAPLWTPSPERIFVSSADACLRSVSAPKPDWISKETTFRLHQWSIDEPALFWQAVWEFTDVQGKSRASAFVMTPSVFPGAVGSRRAH